jgi:hypothetical protein
VVSRCGGQRVEKLGDPHAADEHVAGRSDLCQIWHCAGQFGAQPFRTRRQQRAMLFDWKVLFARRRINIRGFEFFVAAIFLL